MQKLFFVLFLALFAGTVQADVRPGPEPKPGPARSGPDPSSPKPPGKVCGMGMGLVILGIGVFAALRFSKPRPAGQEGGA
jgi:hypothetical protein